MLIVEDSGCGFDAAFGATNGTTRGGLGLVGMKERSALLNGVLEIDSQPGTGTTVVARIPLINTTLSPFELIGYDPLASKHPIPKTYQSVDGRSIIVRPRV